MKGNRLPPSKMPVMFFLHPDSNRIAGDIPQSSPVVPTIHLSLPAGTAHHTLGICSRSGWLNRMRKRHPCGPCSSRLSWAWLHSHSSLAR